MGQGAIYLLTDRPDRSAALETLIKGIGRCEVVASGEDPAAGVSPQAIVSDLTLSRRESVSRLRAFVPRGKATEIPLVCLLRSTSDQDLRIARDLGATVCFPAYTAPHIVVQALIDQIAAVEPDPRVQPVVQGVSQATQVLTGLFDNVRDGGTVSLPQINAGLDPILSAVREGGLTRWLETVWTHDDATYQHCLLVAGVAAQFVLHLGFRTADREHFVRAALLHDVGKARIPREILNKPGRLTADDSQCDAATLGAVRHHHEMLDGSGYPDGLAGAEISDTVRLLTICDIYAALTERRSYKPPMPAREAMAILESMTGKLEMTLVQRFGDAMVAA
jgi:putative nucleotidyltransferase with HDIG domain